MFARILQWLKGVWNAMIQSSDVKDKLHLDVAISAPMAEALQQWCLLYANQATWLKTNEVYSLNLPAVISGEVARQVTIEMSVKVTAPGSTAPEEKPEKPGVKKAQTRADFLNDQLQVLLGKARTFTEYTAAKGGLMLKPYVSDGKILVDIVQADQFYPVSFDANGSITACVFSDQRQIGANWYTRLEYHTMTEKGCDIVNQAFKSASKDTLGSQVPLTDVPAWKDLEPQATVTDIKAPLYAYFKYPAANSVDPTSPLGVSCYSRAIDLIRQADEQWSGLLWEFDSGKRAMYVDELAFGKDSSGKPLLPIKRLYRTISTDSPVGTNKLFDEWSPDFREQNLLAGLDAILRRVEYNCGLAYGTLSNPQTIDKTATEIKISQQRSYATVVDVQKALQDAVDQLLVAMDTWCTLEDLAPDGDYEVQYDFDDSVIVDKDAQFQQDLRLVTGQIMSKIEFRMRNFNEDEATAKKMLDMVAPEQEAEADLFGQPQTGEKRPPFAKKKEPVKA